MAKHISNMEELEKALMPTMIKMVDVMATKVITSKVFFRIKV